MRHEELLANADFMHYLARSLVLDENGADDLVQQSYVAALKGAPKPGKPIRPWLIGIMKNLARFAWRSEAKRKKREAAWAPHKSPPTPAEVLEQEEVRRQLVKNVLNLDEPYRTAILMRYYRNLPAAETAELLGVPLATAKTHIRRGLILLRKKMELQHKGEALDWRLALAPVAGLSYGAPMASKTLSTGVLLMSVKIKIAMAAVLVLLFSYLTVLIAYHFFKDLNDESLEIVLTQNKDQKEEETEILIKEPVPYKREKLLPEARVENNQEAGIRIYGKVNSLSGHPIPNAQVFLWLTYSKMLSIRTDGYGNYSVILPDWANLSPLSKGTVKIHGFATAPGFLFSEKSTDKTQMSKANLDFVLKPGGAIRGRVIDGSGELTNVGLMIHRKGKPSFLYKRIWNGMYYHKVNKPGYYNIFIEDPNKGRSRPVTVYAEPGVDVQAPDLVLLKCLSLKGAANYPDGAPIAQLTLKAVALEGDIYPFYEYEDQQPTDQDYQGLIVGQAKTDKNGCFEFYGLKPGYFFINSEHMNVEEIRTKETKSYCTGEHKHQVVLPIHRLGVRVLDEYNLTVHGAEVVVKERINQELKPWGHQTFEGRYEIRYFQVTPNRDYQVTARIANFPLQAKQMVRIEPKSHETIVILKLNRSKEMGPKK